jgi:hypothetical protein
MTLRSQTRVLAGTKNRRSPFPIPGTRFSRSGFQKGPVAFVPAANRPSVESLNSVPLVFIGAERGESLLADLKGTDLESLALSC